MKYPTKVYKGFAHLFSISVFLLVFSFSMTQLYRIVLSIIAILGMVICTVGMIRAWDAFAPEVRISKKHLPGRICISALILAVCIWTVIDVKVDWWIPAAYCSIGADICLLYILGPFDPI